MGITAPIWNINFFSLTCAWTKSQKWIVMLSYQSQNLLNFSYLFGGDSTLVPRVTNVRDWSKHRFRQRLLSVCMRQNQSDYHQFSWSPAFSDIIFWNESTLFTPTAYYLFLTWKSWFYSCTHPPCRYCWHSLSFTLASPTPLRQTKNINIFSMVKSFTHSWEKPSGLSEFEQFIS